MHDAVRSDDHDYGLAWRDPFRPQGSIVLRRLQCDVASPEVPDLDRLEQLQGNAVVLFPPEALKNLGEDEIGRQDELPAQKRVQRIGLGRDTAIEVVNPDGTIREDHGRPSAWLGDRPPRAACRDSFGSPTEPAMVRHWAQAS